MPHIFISYAKKDTRALAQALFAALNDVAGISAWMDMSLEADSSWAGQIQHEIDRCDYVVVLLSPDVNRAVTATQRRSFVLNEIDYVQQENKPILPVMVQQTKMPVQLAGVQYIDLTQRSNDPDPVVERVRRRFSLASTPEPVIALKEERQLPSRTPLLMGVVGVLGLIAIVALIVLPALNPPALTPTVTTPNPTLTEDAFAVADLGSPTLVQTFEPTTTPSATFTPAPTDTPTPNETQREGTLQAVMQNLQTEQALLQHAGLVSVLVNATGDILYLHGRSGMFLEPSPGEAGINPVVYAWRDGRARRRSLGEARALMTGAGYPDGRNPTTGQPLTLYFDAYAMGPDIKAQFNWYRKQFAKLGIQLVVRTTDYNRFQDKVRKGDAQIFGWGWNADYPDPENFFFLLYGPHGKVLHQGENASNYANADFDRAYLQMRSLPNGPERQAVIDYMLDLVRHDAPWLWGIHPQGYSLHHAWYHNGKANMMARNTLKYRRLDPRTRATQRRVWNRPVLTPLVAVAVLVAGVGAGARRIYARRRRAAAT